MNRFFLKIKEAYDNDVNSTIAFEKVDCESSKKFCETHNVTKLLEVKYFTHDDTDNKKMLEFIQERIDESLVTHAAEEDAKAKLKDGLSFVKFYSPNCPSCQAMAGAWTDLEKTYANNQNLKVLSIDCKVARMTCVKFKIANFPTTIFFNDGKADEPYAGEKSLEGFTNYLTEKVKSIEPKKNASENHVLYLTPENFNESISKGVFFVKFNLRGCVHCVVSISFSIVFQIHKRVCIHVYSLRFSIPLGRKRRTTCHLLKV